MGTTAAHLVRAALEGIAGQVALLARAAAQDVGASLEATIDCVGFTLTAATTPRETPGLTLGLPVLAELPPHACKLIAARAAH